MKKEIADLWVAALRSGMFEQGTGSLVNKHSDGQMGYCCLGVLCELSPTIGQEDGAIRTYGGEGAVLPGSVMKWAGVRTTNGAYGMYSEDGCLSSKNDNGYTFVELADVIEKNWKNL